MKTRLSVLLWILIVAVASQGAVPGLVVCVEPAGHVQVEAITVKCCNGETASSRENFALALTSSQDSERGDSCGPCTDAPLSPVPITRLAGNEDVETILLTSTALAFDPAAIETEIYSASGFVAAEAALIPIKTTTLLI